MSKKFEQTSFLFGNNAVFVEELYQLYLANPQLVDPSWQQFFEDFVEENRQSVGSRGKIIAAEQPKSSIFTEQIIASSAVVTDSLKAN